MPWPGRTATDMQLRDSHPEHRSEHVWPFAELGWPESPDAKAVRCGTHRVRSFVETWDSLRPNLAPAGITRVANVTGLDDIGIPVMMVCRPNARTVAVSQGKGLSPDAARISGVLEAIEIFHAEELEPTSEPATATAMAQEASILDLSALPLQTPESWVDRERRIAWIDGIDLVSGEHRAIPYECVQMGRVAPSVRMFASTSSGLASGNTHMEAVSHAVCELVERHAAVTWHELPTAVRRTTGVDLGTVEDLSCRTLIDHFAQAGVAVGVWEITSEIAIPAFACYIAQRFTRHARWPRPAAGFGCHPSRDVALARALTEAAQSRLTHISGARDDMTEDQYRDASRPAFTRAVLDFIDQSSLRDFADAPTWDSSTLGADVEWELAQLTQASVREVVVVDLTRSDFCIPVVRVAIPCLRIPRFTSAAHIERVGA